MTNPLEKWVEEQARLAMPDRVYWCNGSEEEARKIIDIGINKEQIEGHPVFQKLNHKLWPNSYFHRSHHDDVARTEQVTFVCHPERELSGPTNNWQEPKKAIAMLKGLSKGCMKGRTMYVLPYMMGHPDSPYSKACIQLTDISYVAANMRIMTRMGKNVIDKIGESDNFVKGFHSLGDLDKNHRFVMHFPQDNLVWSIGSGYGGNALLGKKCFSLRIASYLGFIEGWLAEHMVIFGLENPKGEIKYIAAAFPSACGKTNLAMLQSALPGYKVWTVGDDIAWLNAGTDGRLYAINPESGFFCVAPGTSMDTNANMVRTIKNNKYFPTIYTNVALNPKTNEPWWEGYTKTPPKNLIDWLGNKWDKSKGERAAHPNSRITVSAYNAPTLSKEFDNPKGVPISAIIFGGRRSSLIPLVVESFDWAHGVFTGARTGSEGTAAATDVKKALRRDPMAMLPFCGYNMGDYFKHWIGMGERLARPPRIFSVNWFRKDKAGKFLWPGFGENIRVLNWILDRLDGNVKARETPIGYVPYPNDLNIEGLKISKSDIDELCEVDIRQWDGEVKDIKAFFKQFGKHLPNEFNEEIAKLEK